MSGQGTFDFVPEMPPRPKRPERLFLGLFPDPPAACEVQSIGRGAAREFGLTGRMLKLERFHTSLIHVSDRKSVRSRDIFAVELAARRVRVAPFELTFSQLGSFSGAPKKGRPLEHPLVLLADDGPILELYALLCIGLREFQYRVPEHFRPHLTLSYNEQFVPMRAIEPIRFMVTEFALIHSELWLTRYNILRTWPLD
jgi:2'-5' RNA ligase